MSVLEELKAELCPDGVEYKRLGEVLTLRNGKDYRHLGSGNIPVYGTGGIMTYVDSYVYDKPSVLIPRKGSLNKLYYVDVPFWNVDTIFYSEIFTDIANPKFIYYVLESEHLENLNEAGAVPSLTQKVLNKILIPVPPLEVQAEIVRILDKWSDANTGLIACLTRELDLRKQQYAYYRDKLLTFGDETPRVPLGEVIHSLRTGLNPRKFFKLNTEDAHNYYITIREMHNGKIMPTDKTDRINDEAMRLCNKRSNLEAGDVLFSGTGTIGETVVIEETPTNWNIKEGIFAIKPKQDRIQPHFLRHILNSSSIKNAYMDKAVYGTMHSITMKDMLTLQIPVPPIEQQIRIASILDRFDTLCSDLTHGLPAKISARRKQYEYYRDKLLTFTPKS